MCGSYMDLRDRLSLKKQEEDCLCILSSRFDF